MSWPTKFFSRHVWTAGSSTAMASAGAPSRARKLPCATASTILLSRWSAASAARSPCRTSSSAPCVSPSPARASAAGAQPLDGGIQTARAPDGRAHGQADVDTEAGGLGRLRESAEGIEDQLVELHGLGVDEERCGLLGRRPRIVDDLVPNLAA